MYDVTPHYVIFSRVTVYTCGHIQCNGVTIHIECEPDKRRETVLMNGF